MDPALILLLAFLIGVVTGLRSLSAPAVVAWAAHLGWINLHGSRLAFLGSTTVVVVLSILAVAELVADKLPKTPNRTALPGLLARFIFGAIVGASLAFVGQQNSYVGGVLGSLGGMVGAFAGYQARTRLVKALKVSDLPVALLEDLVAIGSAFLIVSRFR